MKPTEKTVKNSNCTRKSLTIENRVFTVTKEKLLVEHRKKLPSIHLCLTLIMPKHPCAKLKAQGLIKQPRGKGRGGISAYDG